MRAIGIALQVAGMTAASAAAFLVETWVGLAVTGGCLFAAGVQLERESG